MPFVGRYGRIGVGVGEGVGVGVSVGVGVGVAAARCLLVPPPLNHYLFTTPSRHPFFPRPVVLIKARHQLIR